MHESDFTVSAILLTGIKFPTGDSSRLKEEFHEVEVEGAPESAIHGHDLTLGTGSYDGIFGEQTSLRYKKMFLETNVQFAARDEGTHDYRFADDLVWNGGPGYYLVRNADTILGLQFVASGEYKGRDRFRGQPAVDTGISSVFLGPRVVASRGRWSAEVCRRASGIHPQYGAAGRSGLQAARRDFGPVLMRGYERKMIEHAVIHARYFHETTLDPHHVRHHRSRNCRRHRYWRSSVASGRSASCARRFSRSFSQSL